MRFDCLGENNSCDGCQAEIGKEFREYDDRTCIIVIDVDNMFVGLIVDSVCEVMSIPDGEIVVPPDFDQSENKFIKGIGKTGNEVRLILDCEKLLKD